MIGGSYDPLHTSGTGLTDELNRLEAQANLSFDDEWRVIDQAHLVEDGELVEIGAGSGAITRRLRTVLPNARLIALDVDIQLLRHARNSGAEIVVCDGSRLPLTDQSVDTVIIRYVLQHVADPLRLLTEARRVLRPGGRVLVIDVDDSCWGAADPRHVGLASVHAKIAAAQHSAGGDRTVGRRLTRLLRAADFEDVQLRLATTTSDGRDRADFAPHLGPERLQPLVAAGHVSLADLALVAQQWRNFRDDPDFWVALISFVGYGTAPQLINERTQ